jgi:formylglycine-generating enzyme required for sulfatase activity
VGNPGNGPDDTGFGSVPYVYRISKHEVTNAQYAEFLNAVDSIGANANLGASDPFLYNSRMSSDPNGGIDFNSGAANGSKYQVKSGRDNNPVVWVSFFDAMRFTNWLQNGQGSGSTESGVYMIGNGVNEIRNPAAAYFIPSENEWYKAAYHKNDGATANYWEYPTSTDAEPFSSKPPGTAAPIQSNTANIYKDDGIANGYDDGFATTGSGAEIDSQTYLIDVGAFTTSLSPYGTFDQAGNVNEWNEAVIEQPFLGRVFRGGNWYVPNFSGYPASWSQLHAFPSFDNSNIGFRVASIPLPEPRTGLLGLLGAAGLSLQRRERW